MTYTERALQLRPAIEKAAQSLDDSVALTSVELFPVWEQLVKSGTMAERGFRFRYGGNLYRVEQPSYIFVDTYIPGSTGTESLFSVVVEDHSGSREDPIPYTANMEIYEGLYYTQYDVIYLCTRSSGQPLYHNLSALVGLYVEVAV